MRRPLAILLFFVLLVMTASGCGTDQKAAVRNTLNRFARATARKDYRTVCSLLSPTLVRNVEQIGLPCEQAVAEGLGSATVPRLVVRSVVIKGNRATAQVHTTAANQAPLDGSVGLELVGGQWRLSSLAPRS